MGIYVIIKTKIGISNLAKNTLADKSIIIIKYDRNKDKIIDKIQEAKGIINPNKGKSIPKIITKGMTGKIRIFEIKETKEK